MFSLNKILMTTICAIGLSTITFNASAYDGRYNNGYHTHQAYPKGHIQRHSVPIYTLPQGVARPHRFVCGADVFTGHYNCVKKSKAHFVRPMYHAPAPRYYAPEPRRYAPTPRHHYYERGW